MNFPAADTLSLASTCASSRNGTKAPSQRIVALDGLRGLAILLVLIAHLFVGDMPHHSPVRLAAEITVHGVDLFFVLSGFLIAGILFDHRDAPRMLPVFYLRRALRIIPLYALIVIFLLGMALKMPSVGQPWWTFATFTSNLYIVWEDAKPWAPLGVMWSLAVEEQFYIIAPLVIRFCRSQLVPWILVAFVVGAYLLRLAIWTGAGKQGLLGIHFLTPCRADAFAIGMLAAWLVRRPPSDRVRSWISNRWQPLTLLLTTALLAFIIGRSASLQGCSVYFGYSTVALLAGLMIFVTVVVQPPGLRRTLETRPFVSLGVHSYFIYLTHRILIYAADRHLGFDGFGFATPAHIFRAGAVVLAAWGAATISWRWFEHPIIRLGQRFSY